MPKHVLERLAEANPDAEIWWDSSPLVYASWAEGVKQKAPGTKRDTWSEQVDRLFDTDHVEKMLFRGVTTNPPLSLNAIRDDPEYWAQFVTGLIQQHSDEDVESIFWRTYKEIVRRGAEAMRPVWEASKGKYGYVSGQVDPRYAFDYDAMMAQALEIADLAPNVMVKSPGSREGYRIIEQLTARGIATNNTSSFSVPQFHACMQAVARGLETAKANGVDLFRWRSVITHMSDRFGSLGDLKEQAEARGIDLSEADQRWAEVALFKRAIRLIRDNGYPSKMLMCSMRISPPTDDGSAASWHIEKIAGADVVYTCPPKYISQLMQVEDKLKPFDPAAIDEEVPADVLNRLLRIPYFEQSYEPDGMTPDQFNRYASLIATTAEFSTATRRMVDFVAQQMQKLGMPVKSNPPAQR